MNLSVMLGLQPYNFPLGVATIYRNLDEDDDEPEVKEPVSTAPVAMSRETCKQSMCAVDRYEAAFWALGGKATVKDIACHIGKSEQAVARYLKRHTGRYVRKIGREKQGAIFEWVL